MSETKITKMVVQKEGKKLIFNPAGDVDLSSYYTKTEIDNKLSTYALKSEIPNTSNFALKSEIPITSNFATKTEVQSAQNTANNALNVANMKAVFNINKSTESSRDTSIKSKVFSGNRQGYFEPGGDSTRGVISQNGYRLFSGIGVSVVNGGYFIVEGNSTVSCSDGLFYCVNSL